MPSVNSNAFRNSGEASAMDRFVRSTYAMVNPKHSRQTMPQRGFRTLRLLVSACRVIAFNATVWLK
jgi:hypothetical protein